MAPRPDASSGNAAPAVKEMDDIDKLNALVQRKVAEGGKGVEPAAYAFMKEAQAKGGIDVYHRRNRYVVAAYCALAVWLLSQTPSILFLVGAFAMQWLSVDFYGAVLHVVLDTPEFIRLPLIGPGALEFQFHHSLPGDIVSKDFVEVSGVGGENGASHAPPDTTPHPAGAHTRAHTPPVHAPPPPVAPGIPHSGA
jgi:hypothetical protein